MGPAVEIAVLLQSELPQPIVEQSDERIGETGSAGLDHALQAHALGLRGDLEQHNLPSSLGGYSWTTNFSA